MNKYKNEAYSSENLVLKKSNIALIARLTLQTYV